MFGSLTTLTALDISGFNTSNVTDMNGMFTYCEKLTELDVSSFDTSSIRDMDYMFCGCSSLTALDLSSFDTSSVRYMPEMFCDCSALTTIMVSDLWNTDAVISSEKMFLGCTNLVGGNGTVYDSSKTDKTYARIDKPGQPGYLTQAQAAGSVTLSDDGTLTLSGAVTKDQIRDYRSNWRVKRVVAADDCVLPADCSELFYGDYDFNDDGAGEMYQVYWDNLTSIDLSKADTSRVTTMHAMFGYLTTLKALDISGFNTSNVTDMSRMFSSCATLTAIDVSSFDTTKVTDMSEMFSMRGFNCSLTTLDLSSFDTSNVTSMYWMFYCLSVEAIYVSDTWTTAALTDQRAIFYENYYLVGGNGTVYDDSKPDKTYARIDRPGQPGFLTEKQGGTGSVTLSSDGTLTLSGAVTREQIHAYSNNDSVKRIYAASDCVLPVNCSNLFANSSLYSGLVYWKQLTSIDLSNADTSNVTTMRMMFYEQKCITELNVSGWDTSKVTNMDNMFRECSSLTALDLSSFDTSNVTNMIRMFYECSSLTALDLSSFDTSNVTDMDYMFRECSSLTALDLSSFHTENVTHMYRMFSECSSLTALDLSSFDTSSIKDMSYMFYECSSLTGLDLSSFDTSSVKDMSYMFYQCSSLTGLDLSSFDTSNVTNMGDMFCKCSSLTELDLSSFDTSSVKDMSYMFSDCSVLTTIMASDLWNTNAVTSSNYMFDDCTNLVGGNGTACSPFKWGAKYACIDTAEQPGYFTNGCTVTYELSIAGTQVTAANKSDILGNGVFTYNPAKKRLTINGDFTTAADRLIENHIPGLTVYTANDSVLESFGPVLFCQADTRITGPGKLTLCSETDCGIYQINGELTIEDADIDASGQWGIAGRPNNESLKIINSGIHAVGISGAVMDFAYGITLDGCSIVSPTGGRIVNGYIAQSDGSVASNVEIDTLYGLRIAGTEVTRLNKSDILGNGVFSYDPASKTLHIHADYSYSGTIIDNESYGSNRVEGLTVCTDSESTLNAGSGTCIVSDHSLTMTGEMLHLRGRNGVRVAFSYGCYEGEDPDVEIEDIQLTLNEAALDIQTAEEAIFCSMIEDTTDGEGGEFPDYYSQKIFINSSEISAESQDKAAVIGNLSLSGCSIISPANAEAKKGYVEYLYDNAGSVFVGNDYAKKVVISAKTPISAVTVSLSKTEFPYTGSAVKVGSYLSVKYNGTPLTYGTDFTTSYANNKNIGYQTASVTVNGKGSYTGSVTLYYSILPKKQAAPTLSMDGTALHVAWTADSNAQGYQVQYCKDSSFTGSTLHTVSYTGKTACTLSQYPKLGETWYVRVRSYITDSSGTKRGIWSDTASKKLTAAITSVMLSKTSFPYTGSAVKVGSFLTVKCGDTKLTYGTDYTTSYTANTAVGYQTAKVTVTGTGKYSGTFTKKYTIYPKKQAKPALSMSGTALHVEWTADSSALGYELEYCQNSSFSTTDATYHTVTYTGKNAVNLSKYPKPGETWYVRVRAFITNDGKTTGTKYGAWSDAASMKLAYAITSVTLSKTQFAYNGNAVKVGSYLSVMYGDTKLTYGTDYTTSYQNNVNVGFETASVTVKGIGNYSGTFTKKYTIYPKKQAKPALSMSGTALHVEWTADPSAVGYELEYCQNSSFSKTDASYHTVTYTGRTSCNLSTYPKLGETWYVRVRAFITNNGSTSGTKYGAWSDAASKKLTAAITSVNLSKTEFNYTGSAITVGSYLTVKCGETKLTYGTDYTTTYNNNTNCGVETASVTVKGIGKYSGTFTKKFTIVPAKQAKPTLTAVSGGFKAEWTADSNAIGYELVYCKNSSFTGETLHSYVYTTTSATLTKYPATGEKWYVKVRAVISSDGTTSGTLYGTYSAVASITAG